MTVNVTGVNNATPNQPFLKSLDDIKIANRPELIPRYIQAKLCEKRKSYITNITSYQQIFDIIHSMNLSDYFKEDAEYTEDIQCLLFHDIICNLRANALEICNKQALYDLLEI